jgi:methionine-rich copper-binding protein CopC
MTRYRLLAAVAASLVLSAAPALAHAILTASTPKPDGTLAAGHQKLHFDYNSRIDHRRSRLTLTGPSGKPVVLQVSPGSASNALDAEADLVPGSYTLRWQALALDGHITRGDVPFSVTSASASR